VLLLSGNRLRTDGAAAAAGGGGDLRACGITARGLRPQLRGSAVVCRHRVWVRLGAVRTNLFVSRP
jgi:hypothetical protein